jgi:hypothetical protein
MNERSISDYDMSLANINSIQEIYNTLELDYTIDLDNTYNFDIKTFASFEQNKVNDWGPFIRISNEHKFFYLAFIEVRDYLPRDKYSSAGSIEYQTWGTLKLAKNYGHILIRPESLIDKILEFINPIQLDFPEDKKFSRGFFVLTDDKFKADFFFTPTLRELIKAIDVKDFIIEIFGDRLIIGNKKVIELNSALEFAYFLNEVSRAF